MAGVPAPSPPPGSRSSSDPVPSSPAQFRSLIDDELHVGLTNPDNVLAYRFDPQTRSASGSTPGSSPASTAAWGSGSGPARARRRRPARRAGRRRRAGLRLRARPLHPARASAAWAATDYEVVNSVDAPAAPRPCSTATAPPPCSAPATSSPPRRAGCTLVASVRDAALPLPRHRGLRRARRAPGGGPRPRRRAHRRPPHASSAASWPRRASRRPPPGSASTRSRTAVRRAPGRPGDRLVADGAVDPAALRTVLDLRRRWLPRVVDGRDVLADALADPGLVVRRERGAADGRLAAAALQPTTLVSTLDRFAMPPMLVAIAAGLDVPLTQSSPRPAPTSSSTGSPAAVGLPPDRYGRVRTLRAAWWWPARSPGLRAQPDGAGARHPARRSPAVSSARRTPRPSSTSATPSPGPPPAGLAG